MARKKVDEDEDDDRPEPKQKGKPWPPALLVCALTTLGWGGVFTIYFIYKLVQTTRLLLGALGDDPTRALREVEFLRGAVITLMVLYVLLLLLAALTLVGGVGLIRRRESGVLLAMYCPGAAVVVALVGVAVELVFIRGSTQFVAHLLGLLMTFVLGLAACIFHCWVLLDRKNTKVLK